MLPRHLDCKSLPIISIFQHTLQLCRFYNVFVPKRQATRMIQSWERRHRSPCLGCTESPGRLSVHPFTPAKTRCLITVYLQLSEQLMGPSASERLRVKRVQRQSKGRQSHQPYTRQELQNSTPALRTSLDLRNIIWGVSPTEN